MYHKGERVFIKGYLKENIDINNISLTTDYEENNGNVSNTYYGVRQGRVHYPDELMNTLACDGHNGGGSQVIIDNRKIKKVGNFSPSGHRGKNVYSEDGLYPCLCSMDVVKNGLNVRIHEKTNYTFDENNYDDKEMIVENIPMKVHKRKYNVDINKLQELLKYSKKQSGLTNQQIADNLKLPLTHVAHWFRNDKYFTIPSKEIWFDLKKLLKITDDSFDKPITEFIECDGVYDMSSRCYSDKGIAPTLKANTKGELIKEHDNELHCLNKKAAQAQKVYGIDGLSCTLSANGGGQGGKTGLYLIPKNIDR